jgi:hypothetical protein
MTSRNNADPLVLLPWRTWRALLKKSKFVASECAAGPHREIGGRETLTNRFPEIQ